MDRGLPLLVDASSTLVEPLGKRRRERREILAWGIETETGEPRYIRDLTREQTGQACGIECVGCGRELEAFNAGAVRWQRRPHFKHPAGTRREDCHIVAARLALVYTATRGGGITLPARSRSASWVGLTGIRYEAWRNVPSEEVRVQRVDYTDRTRAMITLHDGRRIAVMLRGEFSLQGDGSDDDLACLTIEAGPDAELLSQLGPDELRQRLTLLPDLMAWRCHWKDAELSDGAQADARERARDAVDEWPAALADQAGDRRRESLLHRMVRDMLVEAGVIDVPGWRIPVEPGDLRTWAPVPKHRLTLSNLREERGLAGRVPDIQCDAVAEDASLNLPLLAIEVIVHNDVTQEKLAELREAGAAVLAVSLKNWGGRLTLRELRSVVVTGLECKRWLHHPLRESRFAEIVRERATSKAWEEWRRNGPAVGDRSAWRPAPAEDDYAAQEALLQFGSMYRQAAMSFHDISRFRGGHGTPTLEDLQEFTPMLQDIWAELCWIASELADLGAPGGADHAVLRGLMPRLLSIRENRGIGHAPSQNARAVINHVWTEIKVRDGDEDDDAEAQPSPSAALALIAFQIYELKDRNKASSRPFDQVSALVHRSLFAGERRYLWDLLYTPLMRAVFPELVDMIDRLNPRMEHIDAGPHADKDMDSVKGSRAAGGTGSPQPQAPRLAGVPAEAGFGRRLLELSAEEVSAMRDTLRGRPNRQ